MQDQDLKAPIVKKKDTKLVKHNEVRIDPYFWLNDKDNPEVHKHLQAENQHTETSLEHTHKLQEKIFSELKGRIKEDDNSPPMSEDQYLYYHRYVEGQQYPLYCRKLKDQNAPEEVILDQNKLAIDRSYLSIGFIANSPNHKLLAYSIDDSGDESYRVIIKNLSDGSEFDLGINDAASSFEWIEDSKSFLFTRLDEHFRPLSVYKSKFCNDKFENIELVFEENDPKFFVSLDSSEDQEYIFICLHGNNCSEVWFSPNTAPISNFKCIAPRSPDHEYDVTHCDQKFLIISNHNAENFALYSCSTSSTDTTSWNLWREYNPNVLTESLTIYERFIAIEEKVKALPRIRVIDRRTKEEFFIDYGDEPCQLEIISPREYQTSTLRYIYSSLASPAHVYDFDMETKKNTLVKKQEIPDKDFDSEHYICTRIYIKSHDDLDIPVSLLYKKDLDMNQTHPLYLYAYGAYGSSIDAGFSSSRFSYVDRGFIFAIAHIRGGMELGRQWYLNGKLANKQNTFSDFISVSKGLISLGYTQKGSIVAKGGSAGGLTMGAVANQSPDLYGAIIADVPFVDVLTTMLDDSLPLTTIEYNEWGNPNDLESYKNIRAYSPYDNIEAKDYPPMLVICGLHDMRVTYWEPVKWVAKLRDYKSNPETPIYLKIHMDAGHSGSSGRYDYLKDLALEMAFVLDSFDLADNI